LSTTADRWIRFLNISLFETLICRQKLFGKHFLLLLEKKREKEKSSLRFREGKREHMKAAKSRNLHMIHFGSLEIYSVTIPNSLAQPTLFVTLNIISVNRDKDSVESRALRVCTIPTPNESYHTYNFYL